ncbi:MAG TPA: VOC family protein [Stellaceae bacterium]|nr:VOC family protein [Stellaceae bacterium]
MAVTRIARVSLTTADPDGLAAFYCEALGFERRGIAHREEQRFSQLMGLDSTEARTLLLDLGRQTLELVGFAPSGRRYPPDITANDPRFQHIAIVVADMEAAHARLSACLGWTPITHPAPQRLPASSGGVVAFKFRDPEGHPLELLAFPLDRVPPPWREPQRQGPCLGIDHSAVVVADTTRSVRFYEKLLGFRVTSRSLNRGPEQDRLDGVVAALVEVTALAPDTAEPPHLELLCYRSPAKTLPPEALPHSSDVAATQLVFAVDRLPELVPDLLAAEVGLISAGMVTLDDGRPAALIRDPDGHALLLLGS